MSAGFAEKFAAEIAPRRVKGVKAVAEEIEVKLPFSIKRSDEQIAAAAIDSLLWDVSVPRDAVKVTVEKGWRNLTGGGEWQYQRNAAEKDVRRLSGVVSVMTEITIKASGVNTATISEDIRHALHRTWFNPKTITVSAHGGAFPPGATIRSSTLPAASPASYGTGLPTTGVVP
jgi:osmotically-inducible protein OsmY